MQKRQQKNLLILTLILDTMKKNTFPKNSFITKAVTPRICSLNSYYLPSQKNILSEECNLKSFRDTQPK